MRRCYWDGSVYSVSTVNNLEREPSAVALSFTPIKSTHSLHIFVLEALVASGWLCE